MMLDVLLSSFLASAGGGLTFGNEAGNGGDVVICPNGTFADEVTVLDYFEAKKMMPQLPLDLVGKDAIELVERALSRLHRLDKDRAERYRRDADELLNGKATYFLRGIVLRDITDSGYIPLGDCKIRQAIIQKEPWHPLDRRYTFDEDVWSILSIGDQAGLILHEVIYREVLDLGQRNSSAVRQLVAWLSSPLFDDVTPEQYADIKEAIFFVPKLLAFNQERITLYAPFNAHSVFDLSRFVAHAEPADLIWRMDDRTPEQLRISPKTGELHVSLEAEANSVLRTSITVTSGILWDVVPVDVVPIVEGVYPPRWLADEFEIQTGASEITKSFELPAVIRADHGEMLKFRMISGPKGVTITSNGTVTIDQTFIGRARVEVAAFNDSGWTQTSFMVGRE